jgi:anti-sigma factor (TIGR02949 family)
MTQIDRYTCDETFRRLHDYLDRELSPEEMRRVESHLAVCAYCVLEFAFEANVLREVRAKLQSIRAPESLVLKLFDALAQAQNELGATGSGEQEHAGD